MSPGPHGASFAKADAESRAAFEELLPDDERLTVRPMFGNVAAFVNGNMFTGLFGQDLFVRLPEDAREQLIEKGGSEFSPMPGRSMKEYAAVPRPWRKDPRSARSWIEESLAWASQLPPKKKR